MDFALSFFKWITSLSWEFLLTCLAITSSIMFSQSVRNVMKLEQFYLQYTLWFTLIFIVCSCLLTVKILRYTTTTAMVHFRFKNLLLDLDERERQLVFYVFNNHDGAVWIPFDDPTVSSLLQKNILILTIRNVMPRKEHEYALCCCCRLNPRAIDIIKNDSRH